MHFKEMQIRLLKIIEKNIEMNLRLNHRLEVNSLIGCIVIRMWIAQAFRSVLSLGTAYHGDAIGPAAIRESNGEQDCMKE